MAPPLRPVCPVGSAMCSGDNLGIARYCVGAGRPGGPNCMRCWIPLNDAACSPRRRAWIALRR
eukprot:8539604-Lingulodinium_polyedra.AAC.1